MKIRITFVVLALGIAVSNYTAGYYKGKHVADRWWTNKPDSWAINNSNPILELGEVNQKEDVDTLWRNTAGVEVWRLIEQRHGESREHVFSRCGDSGPCTIIWHNSSIDGPVNYTQRCDRDIKLSPDGKGVPCVVIEPDPKDIVMQKNFKVIVLPGPDHLYNIHYAQRESDCGDAKLCFIPTEMPLELPMGEQHYERH